MTGYETYLMYVALKTHFTSEKFDYFNYGGKNKTRANPKSYEKHKNKILFSRLGKKYPKDLEMVLVSNFVKDIGINGVYELSRNDSHQNYLQWKKISQAQLYYFQNDTKKLLDKYEKYANLLKHESPQLLDEYIRDGISFHTLCLYYILFDLKDKWTPLENYHPLWKSTKFKIIKSLGWIDTSNLKSFKQALIECLNT